MDQRPKNKSENCKTSRRKHENNLIILNLLKIS